MSINTVTIEGRIGNAPVVKHFASGSGVAEFSVAVTTKRKDKATDAFVDHTTWVPVKVLGSAQRMGFIEQNVGKGCKIVLSGALSQDEWTTKEGQKVTKLYMLANDIALMSGSGTTAAAAPAAAAPAPSDFDDDFSF